MPIALTVRELTLPGEPLDAATVLTGEEGLGNAVSWVVSLRPYSPAFPRLKGGELALVAAENMARLDPPITLMQVIQLLKSVEAAAIVVRGEVHAAAIEAARKAHLPLLSLPPGEALADIEQAVMRECALFQARQEIAPPQEPDAWLKDLLTGSEVEVESATRRAAHAGYYAGHAYAVAFLRLPDAHNTRRATLAMASIEKAAGGTQENREGQIATARLEGGLALLLQGAGTQDRLANLLQVAGEGEVQVACGIGSAKPLPQAGESLREAQLAATASAFFYACRATEYPRLGALQLLLLLHRDQPEQLRAFVEQTIGPLLKHDARAASPLLPTVRAYIEHGGRLRDTAQAIFVHRNTLAYRLERAAEILGVDLREPDARLPVEIALRALPLVSQ